MTGSNFYLYCFSLNASFNVLLHCINFSWIEFVPHFFQIDYLILLALNVELSILKGIKTLIIIAVIYTTEAVVKLNHIFTSFSAVQTYDLPALLLGLIAEVMGSNPVQAWRFFPGFNISSYVSPLFKCTIFYIFIRILNGVGCKTIRSLVTSVSEFFWVIVTPKSP